MGRPAIRVTSGSDAGPTLRSRFTVAGWTVEPGMDRLVRNGTTTTVEPRVMEVLVCLARHGGEVVSTDELVAQVWRGTIVGDQPVYRSIARLRKALGDDAQHPRYILTIPKRGYRLIAAVETCGAVPKSIAVLPFVDMSEDQSQQHLGDGIAEELIHTLSNVPGLEVTARRTSFSFKGQNVDIETLSQKLDVEAILEGSVRKSGGRLRITAQLIDASSGYHIWSRSYEREIGDVLAIQDEIAKGALQALELEGQVEQARHAVDEGLSGSM